MPESQLLMLNCYFDGPPPAPHALFSDWFREEGSKGILVGLRISALLSPRRFTRAALTRAPRLGMWRPANDKQTALHLVRSDHTMRRTAFRLFILGLLGISLVCFIHLRRCEGAMAIPSRRQFSQIPFDATVARVIRALAVEVPPEGRPTTFHGPTRFSAQRTADGAWVVRDGLKAHPVDGPGAVLRAARLPAGTPSGDALRMWLQWWGWVPKGKQQ